MCRCVIVQVILIEPTGGNYIPWGANISPTLVCCCPPPFLLAVHSVLYAWKIGCASNVGVYTAAPRSQSSESMYLRSAEHTSNYAQSNKHNLQLSFATLAGLHQALIASDRHERSAKSHIVWVTPGEAVCTPAQLSITPALHVVGQQGLNIADAGISIDATTGAASGPWVAPKPSPSG